MKVIQALQKAISALYGGVFAKNNWAEWPWKMSLYLLRSAIHGFFPKLFHTRAGACTWQLIAVRVQQCPYLVFGLLHSASAEAVAASLLDLPRCRLDSFTQALLAEYDSVQRLLSTELKELLGCIASMLQTCTYNTERMHSKNLRRARKRHSTNTADVKHIALAHMSRAALPCFRMPKTGKQDVARKRKRGRPSSSHTVGAEEPPRKARRGGGGAWRAYQHHMGGGTRFTASSVRLLAQQYRALDLETKAFYRQLGRAGDPNHTALSRSTLSLPSCSAQWFGVVGPLKPVYCPKEGRLCSGDTFSFNSSWVSQTLVVYLAFTMPSGASSHRSGGRSFPKQHKTQPLTNMEGRGPDIPEVDAEAVAKAKVASQLREFAGQAAREHEAHRQQGEQEALRVQEFADSKVGELVESSRLLREVMTWKRVPHSCPMLSAFLDATTACQIAASQKISCAARAAAWQKRHMGIKAPPQVKGKGMRASECMQGGVCVCRTPVRAFWRAASLVIKNQCAEKPHLEKLLSGVVIIAWLGSQKQMDVSDDEVLEGAMLECSHVALQYQRPWRPTLLTLRPQFSAKDFLQALRGPNPEEGSTALPLKDTCDWDFSVPDWDADAPAFHTHFAWVMNLDLALHWSMVILHLSDKASPFPGSTGKVRARVFSEHCINFWNGGERPRRAPVWVEEDDRPQDQPAGDVVGGVAQAEEQPSNVDSDSDVLVELELPEGFQRAEEHLESHGGCDSSRSQVSDSSSSSSKSSSSTSSNSDEEPVHAPPVAAAEFQERDVPAAPGRVDEPPGAAAPEEEEEEEEEAEGAVAAPHAAGSRHVHASTFSWGSFLFTHRGQAPKLAWQVTCRHHAGTSTSRCTKTCAFRTQQESWEALRKLKSWALRAPLYTSKEEHQGGRGVPDMLAEHACLDDVGLDALLGRLPAPS